MCTSFGLSRPCHVSIAKRHRLRCVFIRCLVTCFNFICSNFTQIKTISIGLAIFNVLVMFLFCSHNVFFTTLAIKIPRDPNSPSGSVQCNIYKHHTGFFSYTWSVLKQFVKILLLPSLNRASQWFLVNFKIHRVVFQFLFIYF